MLFYVVTTPNEDGFYDVFDRAANHVTSAATDDRWQIVPGIQCSHPELDDSDIQLEYVGSLSEVHDS